MRKIHVNKIRDGISELCIRANIFLRKDVLAALKKAAAAEKNKTAKKILGVLLENVKIAKKDRLAICQDTGMVSVDLEIGQDVRLAGGALEKAVNDGVKDGYEKGYFRHSVVDPVSRRPARYNVPAIIHLKIASGDKVKITVSPKGFGCENRSQLKMFKPTASMDEVKDFIISAVKSAGPNACPPYTVGVGIGGTADYAMRLSKEALLKKINNRSWKLERELLKEIIKLNIGPMGLGGKTTALAVNILTYPTHIAGMPVAVSIGCHALRSADKTI